MQAKAEEEAKAAAKAAALAKMQSQSPATTGSKGATMTQRVQQ